MKYTDAQEKEAKDYISKFGRRYDTPKGDLYKITMPDGWQFAAKDMQTLKERMMMRMFRDIEPEGHSSM